MKHCLRAVLIGKTPNQIPKIRGSTIIVWKYVVTFPEEGDPRPTGIPSPGSAPLSHFSASINAARAFDASDASTHFNLFPISTISTYAKRDKDVLGSPDCRLSE